MRRIAALAFVLLAAPLSAQPYAVFAEDAGGPTGIEPAAGGGFLVASFYLDAVKRYDAEGEPGPDFAAVGSPTAITSLADGRVLVARYGAFGASGAVEAFTADGTPLGPFAAVDRPLGVEQLTDGRVLVTSRARVLAFSSDGTALPDFDSGFATATTAFQAADGSIYITNQNGSSGTVRRYSAAGVRRPDLATGIEAPVGVAQVGDELYVSELERDRVLRFRLDGTPNGVLATDLSAPGPMLAVADGGVLVGNFESGTIVDVTRAAVAAEAEPRGALSVSAPQPNPASARATWSVSVATPTELRATLHDVLGRELAVLFEGAVADAATVHADVGDLAPGVYIVCVTGKGVSETRTVTVAH